MTMAIAVPTPLRLPAAVRVAAADLCASGPAVIVRRGPADRLLDGRFYMTATPSFAPSASTRQLKSLFKIQGLLILNGELRVAS